MSQHGQLGAIPPLPFRSVSPLESMRSGGAIPPPQKGYLSDTCAIPYENKANGCDTPLCDTISKGSCAIWGGISHWAAKAVHRPCVNLNGTRADRSMLEEGALVSNVGFWCFAQGKDMSAGSADLSACPVVCRALWALHLFGVRCGSLGEVSSSAPCVPGEAPCVPGDFGSVVSTPPVTIQCPKKRHPLLPTLTDTPSKL